MAAIQLLCRFRLVSRSVAPPLGPHDPVVVFSDRLDRCVGNHTVHEVDAGTVGCLRPVGRVCAAWGVPTSSGIVHGELQNPQHTGRDGVPGSGSGCRR